MHNGVNVSLRQRGKFITFEGLDGVGKSTHVQKLALYLRKRGLDVITTREPGGTAIGDKLRAVLLNSRTAGLSPLAELGMMFAARAQHMDELILPALNKGQWVLCDRFTDSSEAYQGGGRGLGSEVVLQLHQLLCHGLQPDLTILMLSDPAQTIARARRRNLKQSKRSQGDENRFERETRNFHQRVLDAYLAIAAREKRVRTVDASRAIAEVQDEIAGIVARELLAHPALR